MSVDFLDFLKGTKGRFALVATYEFDPVFFERRILPTPAFESASVVVFVDADRYRDILTRARQGHGFDRDYLVIPVSRDAGVFHPKLYLSVGDKGAIAAVGSNNCTASGTGHNFELISTFQAKGTEGEGAGAPLVAPIFSLFLEYAQDAGADQPWLKADILDEMRAAYPWLAHTSDTDSRSIELLSSHKGPLWPAILERLEGKVVTKIVMLAPFFDPNLRMVQWARQRWSQVPISILSQSGYSNLPIDRFAALQEQIGDLELIAASPNKAGRNVHAKALAFETEEATYWLAGSANISHAALSGRNSEACLWFATRQDAMSALSQGDLTFEPIVVQDFHSVPIEEPLAQSEAANALDLCSLVLTEEGELLAQIGSRQVASDLVLRIFRRNEGLPTFSWKIAAGRNESKVTLGEDDLAKFDRPAVGQLQGSIGGCEVKSDFASVKQLGRLLRDRSGGQTAASRLQRVMDTGEGLVEYVDGLCDIDAAIDFMNNTTIRFIDDAASEGGGSSAKWRSRDPFSGDFPESWQFGSRDGSDVELRDAIWGFVQRHIEKRLERHAARGNLSGLSNYLDIYRTLVRVLLTFHYRPKEGGPVISAAYVTTGLQAMLATLIGERGDTGDEAPGYGRVILANLSADQDLVREQLQRHRVPALVRATLEETILVRAVSRKLSIHDAWSKERRDWVSGWIDGIGLVAATDADMADVGAEFRVAA